MVCKYALFDTPIGTCGIAWTDRGIAAVRLPERDPTATRTVLASRFPGAWPAEPSPMARRAIEEIENLLSGRPDRLQEIPLDLDGVPAFHRRVYEAVRAIPAGCTTTYGELAARIGAPGAARAVGQAMAQNPFPLIVPCHRVLSSAGRLGGFSAHGGVVTKMRLLLRERDATCAGRLEFDPDAAVEHLRRDPAMARLIETAGPLRPRLRPAESVFDALAHSIVHQQLSGRAASAIHARLAALFPNGHLGLDPRRLLRARMETLQEAGLSRPKIAALRALAESCLRGEIPSFAELREMTDEAIVERLTALRGVGRWTVEMLLIFRLGRPDVWPVDDLGVRKGYALTFGTDLPSPVELAALGERFRPYRSAAAWYFWRAVEIHGRSRGDERRRSPFWKANPKRVPPLLRAC